MLTLDVVLAVIALGCLVRRRLTDQVLERRWREDNKGHEARGFWHSMKEQD